ncbi:MAG TPA: hypothetical protein VFL96_00730 [Acidobacteriaceae bacterium]|nr:hypothetical protein [Acidobacteriaceae bacterium]
MTFTSATAMTLRAPAYGLAVLLKIGLPAYSREPVSSRRMKVSRENMLFIAVSGGSQPRFTNFCKHCSVRSFGIGNETPIGKMYEVNLGCLTEVTDEELSKFPSLKLKDCTTNGRTPPEFLATYENSAVINIGLASTLGPACFAATPPSFGVGHLKNGRLLEQANEIQRQLSLRANILRGRWQFGASHGV